MAEKIVSPGVFTKEIDASFLPSAIADGKKDASISFVNTPGEIIFSLLAIYISPIS